MRSMVILALAGLIGMGTPTAQIIKAKPKSAIAPQKVLPVFSFMGDDTVKPTTRTELHGEACFTEGADLKCAAYLNAEVAGAKMGFLTLDYHNRLLYRVVGSFYSRDHSILYAAFTQKYGPAKETTEKWQAKSGATFDNAVSTWRFDGGELKLESMGLEIDKAIFTFVSVKNSPPSAAPKVDF